MSSIDYKERMAITTKMLRGMTFKCRSDTIQVKTAQYSPITDFEEIMQEIANGNKVICVLPDEQMDYNMHRTDAMIILTE